MTVPTNSLDVAILVRCPDWTRDVPDAETICRTAAVAAFGDAPERPDGPTAGIEVNVVLADDPFVQTLNRDYRGKDSATNVLSFANLDSDDPVPDGEPLMLGDVVVAFQTSRAEADAAGISLGAHLSHLVVHAMLHLLGFDHEDETEADRMEQLETEILGRVGIADPYSVPENPDD